MFVYVISKDGQPLMPTKRFGKVRRLLNSNKAKAVKRCPFTIKLLYEPDTTIVQEVVLGQDTGSKHIGTACVANNEVLYQSQVELRSDIKSNMEIRKQFRNFRRYRKTRHRKVRFLNRKNSTKLNRLPPSVKHKVQAHIDEIESCKKILPISKIVLEVSQFDAHLMKNPLLISEKIKHWGYQRGFDYNFASRKEAILNRDNYTCQYCGKKNKRLEVHHIIYRSNGGTDDENNLITLCEECHSKVHKNELVINKKPKRMNLHFATHMNVIRSQLLKVYPEAIETFGFVTKENRNHLSLPKDHYIDAVVIASGGKVVKLDDEIFYKRRVAKGDYQLTKGVRGEQSIPQGKIFGFKKFDKVKYLNKEYFIKGRMSSGYAILMDIFGNKQVFSNPKTVKLTNCERITARCTTLVQRMAIHPIN